MKHCNFLSITFCLCISFSFVCCSDKAKVNNDNSSEEISSEKNLTDDSSPVDISEVIELYKKQNDTDSLSAKDFSRLMGFDYFKHNKIYFYQDTIDFVTLPNYKSHKNKYLNIAQSCYNASIFVFDIWSNFEISARTIYYGGNKVNELNERVINYIEAMNEKSIGDYDLRSAASEYKSDIIKLLKTEENFDSIMDKAYAVSSKFGSEITTINNSFCEEKDIFQSSVDSLFKSLRNQTETQFQEYLKTPEDKRLKFMLESLSKCKTYDDQCSLLINWSDCKESEDDNPWIAAVASRLLKSGKYNFSNDFIWVTWRCLVQSYNFGLSRDSYIPNNLYNDMRRTCFKTIISHLDLHPDDKFATACAINISSRFNMNRYGNYPYGNDCLYDMSLQMPARFK